MPPTATVVQDAKVLIACGQSSPGMAKQMSHYGKAYLSFCLQALLGQTQTCGSLVTAWMASPVRKSFARRTPCASSGWSCPCSSTTAKSVSLHEGLQLNLGRSVTSWHTRSQATMTSY